MLWLSLTRSTSSSRSNDVLWSSDRNSATEALVGVAVDYCDTRVNLLCRDINETAGWFSEDCNALIRRATQVTPRPHGMNAVIFCCLNALPPLASKDLFAGVG
jgi:hypothetical protein